MPFKIRLCVVCLSCLKVQRSYQSHINIHTEISTLSRTTLLKKPKSVDKGQYVLRFLRLRIIILDTSNPVMIIRGVIHLIDLVFIYNFLYFEIKFSRATSCCVRWLEGRQNRDQELPLSSRNNSASFDRNTAGSLNVGLFPIKPRDKPASLETLTAFRLCKTMRPFALF
jgi:hypothetical protein